MILSLIQNKWHPFLIRYKSGKNVPAMVQSVILYYADHFKLEQCAFHECSICIVLFVLALFQLDLKRRLNRKQRHQKMYFLNKHFWRIGFGRLCFYFQLCGPRDKDITNSTLNAATLAQPVMRFWRWFSRNSPPSPHFAFDLACYCHLTIPVLRGWLLGPVPISQAFSRQPHCRSNILKLLKLSWNL